MIKLIIFDLDGVLVDSRELHYQALNQALESIDIKYIIQREEHLAKYDGLSTKQKLLLLTREKGLDESLYNTIWERKQLITHQLVDTTFQYDERIREILRTLKNRGYILYCASNCIWNSVKMFLLRKGFMEYIDFFISNEDVKNPKPAADIYMKSILRSGFSADEIMICEDSHIGREAAIKSGAHLCPIDDPQDLTLDKINSYIRMFDQSNEMTRTPWTKKINVVIPMAGYGSRFSTVGYKDPKPLIQINGKPMIQIVVENINVTGKYIFIVREEHYQKYDLQHLLNKIAPNCEIILVKNVTEGACCTVLLAENFINNEDPLLIVNSDQYLEWNSNAFLYRADSEGVSGAISTFYNTHPKWSYAKLDDNGFVSEVQEKNPISTNATTGIYYWKHGSDFVHYAKSMISKNIRTNGEFYVCPVYNEAIQDGKKIKIIDCNKLWGLGTPEDLTYFTSNFDIHKL